MHLYMCACGMWQSQGARPPGSGSLHLGLWLHHLTQPIAWVVYGLLTQQRKATAGRRSARSGYRGVDVGLHALLLLPRTMDDTRLTPSPVGARQRVHRNPPPTFRINNVRGEHIAALRPPSRRVLPGSSCNLGCYEHIAA
jgi:hypothetical protein